MKRAVIAGVATGGKDGDIVRFRGAKKKLTRSQVRSYLKPMGLIPPAWLCQVACTLSGRTTRGYESVRVKVAGVDDCGLEDVLRFAERGAGISVRECLKTHRRFAVLGFIPIGYAVNHGLLICPFPQGKVIRDIFFYDANEIFPEWDGFTYHKPWDDTRLHRVTNVREFCDSLSRSAALG